MFKKIFNNYKTSIPAIGIVVCVIIYWSNIITSEQFTLGTGLLVSAGLLGAKDIEK